jgi:hypothetical protein
MWIVRIKGGSHNGWYLKRDGDAWIAVPPNEQRSAHEFRNTRDAELIISIIRGSEHFADVGDFSIVKRGLSWPAWFKPPNEAGDQS